MNRASKLLSGLDLQVKQGIEIGALDKPIIPPTTPRVFYVDFLDTQGLRSRYKDDPNVAIDNIVNVGGVWGQQTLAEVAAPATPADFIVASHVIEHVPDLITWLDELGSALSATGEVRLAIPDRRFSFDYLRGETVIADVLAAYINRARVPQPRQVLDFALNMAELDCRQAWEGTIDRALLKKGYTPEDALRLAEEAKAGIYHDVHCWVFTPLSFANLMADLACAGHLRFKCVQFFDTTPLTLEFFLAMQRCDRSDEVIASWVALSTELRRQAQETHTAIEVASAEEATAELRKEYEFQIAEWTSRLTRENGDRARLEARLSDLEAVVAQVKASSSWRLTTPLRALGRLLKGR